MPTEDEISKVIELWDLGKSYSEIASELNNKPRSTVQGWIETLIKRGRIVPRTNGVYTNTKNANNARKTYSRERRLALNDKFFDRLEKFTEEKITARDFKDLMISYGILEDKRALIEPPEPPKNEDGDQFIDALEGKTLVIWDAETNAVQMDQLQSCPTKDSNLVDEK